MESDNHDQGDQSASHIQVRSYECNFCKRGFSNAQALGGHMNIHRKDKARLKQQSLDINIHHHHKVLPPNQVLLEGKSNSTPEDENIHMRKKQLPLFAESPTNYSTTETPQGQLLHGETTTQEGALMLSAGSSELDLELRLGLEPRPDNSSAPTGTTRKFF